jgi:hypothetical protein
MFEVPLDKVLYPTTRFLREDLAIIVDTHGVNMLVEQALANNVDVVVGCCDHPGKVQAAAYLSSKGVDVICFPDKFAYQALGNDLDIVPSPPLTFHENYAVLGDQTVYFSPDDLVIALNATSDQYALWYYQTPTSYFNELEKYIDLNIVYVTISNCGELYKITDLARDSDSNVIAVRVFNSNDYEFFKNCLDESKEHKAILFHSTPYPYGLKIFQEYPHQTSFGDVNPVFQ